MKNHISGAQGLEERLPALVETWRAWARRGEGEIRRLPPLPRLLPKESQAAGKALLSLQRGLTGPRVLPGSGYMEDPDHLGAYLLYYWPISYLQVSLALEWLSRLPGGRPRLDRVLDLGAGPGPASAALFDAGAGEALLLDSSPTALDLASKLLAPAKVETRVADLEQGLPNGLGGNFDLIVACHSLNELWKNGDRAQEKRLDLLREASDLLAPGGVVLLLEPSLLFTSRGLLALRDELTASGSALEVLGPCTRLGPCPALAAGPGHTCHGEVPWVAPEPIASLAAEAGLDRASIKTTWFALGKRAQDGDRARYSDLFASSVPTINPKHGSTETIHDALVVSEAMLNKAGRLRYLLCSEAGRFPLSASRDDEEAKKQGFQGLGRYDLVRLINPEARGDAQAPGWGFQPGTELKILARAPGLGQEKNRE